jgi:hypothetical protein
VSVEGAAGALLASIAVGVIARRLNSFSRRFKQAAVKP